MNGRRPGEQWPRHRKLVFRSDGGRETLVAVVHVVRVFVGREQKHGNALGVFLNGKEVDERDRQSVAADLGYSETVFVDDVELGAVRIFSPRSELAFAGHPLVGTAWLLVQLGTTPVVLRPPAGSVPIWQEGAAFWISGRADWAPAWEQIQLESAESVDCLREPWKGHDFVQFWAWENESEGLIRARVFADRIGVPEDEACGSASLLLAHRLNRALTVRHGEGSIIRVRPRADGSVDVGGDVVADGTREYDLPGR
jgi:predicted PhzF superfamily epimerase YddE/YHI9